MCNQNLKQEQDDKMSDLKGYIEELEDEIYHLSIQVEGLKVLQQKPWKQQNTLTRWDKP